MIKRVLLAVLAIVWLFPVTALAAEPGKGTIEGQVVNGTAGGSSVANLDVTLTTNLNDSKTGTASAKTDASGNFSFTSLATDAGYSYLVSLTFQSADYASDKISFAAGETSKKASVNVYDSTTSDAKLSIVLDHYVVYFSNNSLLIKEYAQFANMSDRTYIGSKPSTIPGKNETLRFSLPKDAIDVTYSMGLAESSIIRSGNGFVDTLPVYPGGVDASYSYTVPYNPAGYDISESINYPVVNFNFLVEDRGVQITGNQLGTPEVLNINGTQLLHYAINNLAAGATIAAHLSGAPLAPAATSPGQTQQGGHTASASTVDVKWVILAVVLVAVAAIIVVLRRRRLQPAAVATGESLEQKRERLLLDVARLDDKFENKQIPEETYRKLRAEKKAQLVALTKGDAGNA